MTRKNNSPEKLLHSQICGYLKLQYPNVYFISDPSGMRVSMGLRMELKRKRSYHKILDLTILEPSACGRFNALIIEIKVNESDVYTKKGILKKDEHIEAQWNSIVHLQSKGYMATFGFGFYDCKSIIDKYLRK